jgi:hypothetical protein
MPQAIKPIDMTRRKEVVLVSKLPVRADAKPKIVPQISISASG